jgi:hypothetical protein
MGFGGGTLLASPLIRSLMDAFVVVPERTACSTEGAVKPTVETLGQMGYSAKTVFGSDCFLGGTGSTGARETLFVMGFCYLVVLGIAGALYIPAAASTASKTPALKASLYSYVRFV